MATTQQSRPERLGSAVLATGVLAAAQLPFAARLAGTGGGSLLHLRLTGGDGTARVLSRWGDAGIDAARMQLVVDVATALAGATAAALAALVALLALRRHARRLRPLLVLAAAAGASAGLVQVLGDAALLQVLDGGGAAWADLARACAFVSTWLAVPALLVAVPALVTGLRLEPEFRTRTLASLVASQRWLAADTAEVPPQCGRPALADVEPVTPDAPVVALCCSGGGIRSAAFSLGGLQALTRHGVYRRARWITAVSGGSYTAAAFAMLRGHSRDAEGRSTLPPTLPAYAAGSPEEARLRTHVRYLVPDRGVAVVGLLGILWGLIVNLGTLLLLGFVGARVLGWSLHALGVGLGFTSADAHVRIPRSLSGLVLGLAAAGLATYVLLDRVHDVYARPRSRWLAAVRGWAVRLLGLAAAAAVLLVGVPVLLHGLYDAGTGNSPTVATARVVHALGFTTAPGCARANEASWQQGRAAALAARDTVRDPAPVSEFRYGACGTAVTGRTDQTRPVPVAGADSGRSQGSAAAGLLAALVALVKSVAGRTGPASGTPRAPGRLARLSALLRRTAAPWAGSAAAVLLLAVVGLRWTEDAMIGGVTARGALVAGLALLAVPALKLVTDANRTSVHPFYRERLASAFAVHRTPEGAAAQIPYDRPLLFSALPEPGPGDAPDSGPELVVCAVANVEDGGAVPPGRGGLPFVFSRTVTGIPVPGVAGPEPFPRQAVTEQYERYAGHRLLTLPAAVAISGAALSPVMGRMTRRPVRLLLGLANVRLGVWLPNPARLLLADPPATGGGRLTRAAHAVLRQWHQPGLRCLLAEMVGRNGVDRTWLYVTDGGHYDNLGLVEALRRRPTLVYAFDGSGDPPDSWQAFGQAVALARADLGVEIEVVGTPPLRRPDGLVDTPVLHAQATHADGLVTEVWVAKLGIPTSATWDVRAYAGSDPTFPARSTADQLYGDLEFEAYRRLGETAGDLMVAAATAPVKPAAITLDRVPAQVSTGTLTGV